MVIPKISQETLAEMIGTTRSRVSLFHDSIQKDGHDSLRWRPLRPQLPPQYRSPRLGAFFQLNLRTVDG